MGFMAQGRMHVHTHTNAHLQGTEEGRVYIKEKDTRSDLEMDL